MMSPAVVGSFAIFNVIIPLTSFLDSGTSSANFSESSERDYLALFLFGGKHSIFHP